jgi:hypothetical protein
MAIDGPIADMPASMTAKPPKLTDTRHRKVFIVISTTLERHFPETPDSSLPAPSADRTLGGDRLDQWLPAEIALAAHFDHHFEAGFGFDEVGEIREFFAREHEAFNNPEQ